MEIDHRKKQVKKPKWKFSLKYSMKEILYVLVTAEKSDKLDIWYVKSLEE